MSELLAMSFDADASPRLRFKPTPESARAAADPYVSSVFGWGVGWYPGSERGASVLKDPTSSGEAAVDQVLGDWNRFRSTLFVCHLRGHRRKRSQEDAQPFVRSYGGRQWIFAHDGDLERGWQQSLSLGEHPAFEPLGHTDSEHAFCWLLARVHGRNARSLGDVDFTEMQRWLAELNTLGQLNVMLTDGDTLLVHRDQAQHGQMYFVRKLPPHGSTHMESDSVLVDLDAPEDPNRTALVFSSVPLSGEPWLPMAGGQLVFARRGSIVWDSHPRVTAMPSVPQPSVASPQFFNQVTPQPTSAQPFAVPASSAESVRPRERTLSIVHETQYIYELPVERSSHRMLLRPVEDSLQRIESFTLSVEPGGAPAPFEDVFGNAAVSLDLLNPYQTLAIRSEARVHVLAPPPIENRGSTTRIPVAWMPWQRQMLSPYLMPMELPETQLEELNAFAMSFVERNDGDLVGTLIDMNETLFRDFEYVTGSTSLTTTPFEVLEARRGVCQDFAGLMICLARLLNVPARYRMGYIFTGADYANTVQSEASHAWAELYVPRVGWHGFDPTNGIEAGADHVRVACGRNYRDATPTSGTIYRGGGTETLQTFVRVEIAS